MPNLTPRFFPPNRCQQHRGVNELLIEGRKIEYMYKKVDGSVHVIIACHGMGRSLDPDSVEKWVGWATESQISILLHNYPGSGGTDGPATEGKIMDDLVQLVLFLGDKGWTEDKMVLLGNSIGCGPTIALAARKEYKFCKVVLISPYISCIAVAIHHYLPGLDISTWSKSVLVWLSKLGPFGCYSLMEHLHSREVLILHGRVDETIPLGNSVQLYELLENGPNTGDKRLCIIKDCVHKDTRYASMKAIRMFVRGEGGLEGELQRLRDEGSEVVNHTEQD